MDPDDSYSPPLDGLLRGKKLNQILTTLRESDSIIESKSVDADESEYQIIAAIQISDVVEGVERPHTIGTMAANWWHMRREPDWWKYQYNEFKFNPEENGDNDGEDAEPELRTSFRITWGREPNEVVDSDTYVETFDGDTTESEPFDPPVDTPKPLSRAIIDSYLPDKLEERHG